LTTPAALARECGTTYLRGAGISFKFAQIQADFVNYESGVQAGRAREGLGAERPLQGQGVHEIRRFARERFAASFDNPRRSA
jgi:hypothetical protein